MNNKVILKNNYKKKRGFTLLELISVIAIITILATAILPKVTGYINEAKKTKVLDQCRKVVMAVESYNLTHSPSYDISKELSDIKSNKSIDKYLGDEKCDNLPESTTIQNCYDILKGCEFSINSSDEKLMIDSINKEKS